MEPKWGVFSERLLPDVNRDKLWLHSALPALHPVQCSVQRMPLRLARFFSPPFYASFNTYVGGLDPVVRTWGTCVPLVCLSRFGCRVHIWIIEKSAPGELSLILLVVWWCGLVDRCGNWRSQFGSTTYLT
jgi:hypothetical protein